MSEQCAVCKQSRPCDCQLKPGGKFTEPMAAMYQWNGSGEGGIVSESYKKVVTYRTKVAAKKFGAKYRKQFDLGLDGQPRQRGTTINRRKSKSDG